MWWCDRRGGTVLLLAVALAAAGCGFRLQGSAGAATLGSTFIDAPDRSSELVRKLERALGRGGVTVTDSRSDADAVLNIITDDAGERVLSVSARAEPRELELYHTVRYEVLVDEEPLLQPQTFTLTRDYVFDEQDILGTLQDSAVLRDALVEDAAAAITRRLAALERRTDVVR